MKQQINWIAATKAKHMQPNPDINANVSRSQEMFIKSVEKPGKEKLKKLSPQNLAGFPSNTQGSTASTRVTTCRNQRFSSCRSRVENDRYNEINLQFIQKKKADGPFLSKKVDGTNQQCKELLDALGIFNSNKELFINLLQDPNSLLITRIEDSTDSRAKKKPTRTLFGGALLENKTGDVRELGEPVYSQDLKPCDRFSSEESEDSQSLERIVVLKPNLNVSQHSLESAIAPKSCINNLENEKQPLFSLRHVKRKIRQAMRVGRKEGECPSAYGMSLKDAGKQMVMDVTEENSHNSIQSDGGGVSGSFRDSQKRDQLGKAFNSRNGDKTASTSESTDQNVRRSAFTSRLKRKKPKKCDGDKETSRKMRAKPWGWMMCFSDDDISPSLKYGFHTAGHMKYSNFSNKKFVCEKKLKAQHEDREGCEAPKMDKVEASLAENRNVILHKLDTDPIIEGSVHHGETNSLEASFQWCNDSYALGEKGNPELSRLDSPLDVQPPTFSVNTSPNCSQDQLLVNASTSPSFPLKTADSSVELLLNTLEDHCSSLHCCDSISGYALELLQASKPNWNELSIERRSSAWLHLPFIDKMKAFNGQLCGDCVVHYDYINEVLEGVFLSHFRISPWIPSSKERALYHEVMKQVDWQLLQQQQPPETLDHIVGRDLMKSETWIDSSTDSEDVISIITESVLGLLIIESIVSL